MSLNREKIEDLGSKTRNKAKSRKWRKNQLIRAIRRTPKDEVPHVKHNGWEY